MLSETDIYFCLAYVAGDIYTESGHNVRLLYNKYTIQIENPMQCRDSNRPFNQFGYTVKFQLKGVRNQG